MRKFHLIVFLGFALFLIVVIALSNAGKSHEVFGAFKVIPHYDKLGHFILMGMLSFFSITALAPRLPMAVGKSSFTIASIVSVLVALEEISQSLNAHRTCSCPDLVCSVAGIVLFGFVGFLMVSRNLRRALNRKND